MSDARNSSAVSGLGESMASWEVQVGERGIKCATRNRVSVAVNWDQDSYVNTHNGCIRLCSDYMAQDVDTYLIRLRGTVRERKRNLNHLLMGIQEYVSRKFKEHFELFVLTDLVLSEGLFESENPILSTFRIFIPICGTLYRGCIRRLENDFAFLTIENANI